MNRMFVLSVTGFFVITMAVAIPWHLVLFHEKYLAMGAMTRDQPIIPLGMLAVVIQSIVFSYFYPLFYKYKGGGSPILRGLQFSLFMGLNVWTVMVFATAAKFKIEPVMDFVLLATAFQVIQFSLVGIMIGWVHGRAQSSSA